MSINECCRKECPANCGCDCHIIKTSEIIEGPERSELGKQYDKYQEAIRIGFAQGQASKEARVKELEEKLKEAIDLLDGIYQTPKECDTCFCMPDGQICEGHEALKKLKG